ncbi:hypothetical protein MTO96_015760 [Rhipicephalus appendiculatus]
MTSSASANAGRPTMDSGAAVVPTHVVESMTLKGLFIGYLLLNFLSATTSGLLWRPFRPKTNDPQCGNAYCPLGNQMACVIRKAQVQTECISQWKSYSGASANARRNHGMPLFRVLAAF